MLSERREGPALGLTIDRPEAKNALSRELCRRLEEAFERAARDETVSAVVLAATGDVFIAGGDLHELAALPMDAGGADRVLELGAVARSIEACALPVIAAVSGAALGGGAEVVLACDLVVMQPGATIRFVHAKMGLTPAWGGTTRLCERVGATRASEILLSARPIGGEEAVAIGLASRVVPEALAGALDLARELAKSPREALAAIKRSLGASRDARRDSAFASEQKIFRSAWGSAAHQAALQSFFAKK